MKTIYLFLMMVSPQGAVEEQGYSQFTFTSLPECHAFVENIASRMEDTIVAFQWTPDFAFRAIAVDGSSAMGHCTEKKEV